ncbi:molybdopterin cofactor-binding domain-containing protein [Cupriavidus basilensis]
MSDTAAQAAGCRAARWHRPPTAHRVRAGIALAPDAFGSVVAQVAEVSLKDGKPRVHRVVCAVDCGTVVDPGIVAQQMESADHFRA